MTLTCVPKGRGKWNSFTLTLDRWPALLLRPGHLITVGDRVLRIVKVEA